MLFVVMKTFSGQARAALVGHTIHFLLAQNNWQMALNQLPGQVHQLVARGGGLEDFFWHWQMFLGLKYNYF
jgi:hypothetical protein